jgi:hypothetical protein
MTARSSKPLPAHTSLEGAVVLRWLDQKSTMTSSSWRSDQHARTNATRTVSSIAVQSPFGNDA